AAAAGNERARLALDAFCYRVVKYIGAYAAAMNGVDVIAFTAGIGENDINVRAQIAERLSFLGAEFDPALNDFRGEERVISTPDSKIKLMVVPTNEELAICRDTVEIVGK
ncbi:MAG: acetate kinase, partial [Eubacteriales bacterium]|nr:acetate kinase [Eubacteriales bacterium]